MDINQIIIGAFMNAIEEGDDKSKTLTEGHKQHGTDVAGTGEKKAHNTGVPGKKGKKFNTDVPMSEGNLRTNLDTKRVEKELDAAPLALAAGTGAMTARKKIAKVKKATVTNQL